ncbi:hypothetical protein D3C80_1164580 [compost metagenome]
MEVQRAGTPAPAGGAVYDSRPQRGTPRPKYSAFSWRSGGLSMRWINQVLQGLATLYYLGANLLRIDRHRAATSHPERLEAVDCLDELTLTRFLGF